MLDVKLIQVRPGRVDRLRAWMVELEARRDEVLETFEQEGVRHEAAYLLDGADGPVLVYAIEAEDLEAARKAYSSSTLPIDLEHRRIMAEVSAGAAPAEQLYECSLP